MPETKTVLVLNFGSSTFKYAVFQGTNRLYKETLRFEPGIPQSIDSLIMQLNLQDIDGVGHRVVHGGGRFQSPIKIEPDQRHALEQLIPLAPLHLPTALAGIDAINRIWPDIPQVACFDTAFHAMLPALEQRFGIPRRFHDSGFRRYGFHGLSYEFIARQLPAVSERAANGRTVVCHLGNGSSLCGMIAGRSHTTTMGMTPLDGLLMATRPGRLDPGVILHWLRNGMTADAIEQILEHESGVLGVSGISSDFKTLQESQSPDAQEAIQLFARIVAKEIAAAAVALGGLDALVFTAGIGEHSASARALICNQLAWLGVHCDEQLNQKHEQRLHSDASAIEIYRIRTDEESIIADHTTNLLGE